MLILDGQILHNGLGAESSIDQIRLLGDSLGTGLNTTSNKAVIISSKLGLCCKDC